MKPRLLMLMLTLLAATAAQAQRGVFRSQPHELAELPAPPQGLSMVGGKLYAYSGQLLMTALRHDDAIVGFMVDTDYVKYDEQATYVVRHPASGDIYFTRPDRKGRSCLFAGHRDGRRYKTRRIKLNDIEVEHPTFSPDGEVMVFASREQRHSFGGYDLWYSEYRDGEWSTPVNMGSRVNSPGDDVTPCVVGDYLYFSSNGRRESKGRLNVFATRLISRQVTGDTIGMLQIGRSRVQQLPQGINSAASDCSDFVVDLHGGVCYWVNSASGIRSYKGALESVMQWGYARDGKEQPLAGVAVTAYDGSLAVAAASTDADGFYRLCLPLGRTYTLRYTLPGHFASEHRLKAVNDDPNNLIGEARHDVTLDALPVGRPFVFTDLFGPDAVVELSPHGIEVLEPLVRFLTDNPGLRAELVLSNDLTADIEFNALLTDQRLMSLERFLAERLPSSVAFTTSNACRGREGCDGATGTSKLTVLLKD